MATTTILYAALTVGLTGLIAAVILYFVSKFFHVEEDPRIDLVQACLPNANCGGCGFAGCRAMAEAIVKNNDLNVAYCPGSDTNKIAEIMHLNAVLHEPQVSTVRCNGTCEHAPMKSFYDSALTCAFANTLFAGEKACPYGCLGCGDCVAACQFDAIHLNPETHLPEVIDFQNSRMDEIDRIAIGRRRGDGAGHPLFPIIHRNSEEEQVARLDAGFRCDWDFGGRFFTRQARQQYHCQQGCVQEPLHLFGRGEIFLAHAAEGAYPVGRQVFESSAGRNAVVGIADGRIVFIAADVAYVLHSRAGF